MIVTLFLISLLQDGPIRTAPQESPDPGPACTFGGRPVAGPGCPTGTGRVFVNDPATRPPEAAASPWSARQGPGAGPDRNSAEGGYSRHPVTEPDGVRAWALTDPLRWETSQCGAAADDACRRQARNRLAMARAGLATGEPASSGESGPPGNCRMVMQRSETGFGGSLSRVCGDGQAAEDALNRLENLTRSQPTVEPCDRPASLETQEAWIARCRGLPPR